jgi:Ca2+-binding RTX toxin-like protein
MARISVTTQDPQQRLAGLPLLQPTLQAAVDYLDRFLVLRGTLDIEVVVDGTPTGRFAATGDTVLAGRRNGLDTWESAGLAESRSGVDPHPADPDITIFIDPRSDYLAHLWWDPGIATGLDANPPDDRTDAFTVLLHELLHGLGIVGWRDTTTGALPGDYQSVWDSLVQVAGGRATFVGAATTELLGQPVEVRLGGSQGAFHLGNAPTGADELSGTAMPWLEASNFNSYYYYDGERYLLGRLELALLQDLGWTLEPGLTLTDVVNRWDDRVAGRYLVGWERDEQLVGDVEADRIEGRGGSDLLVGLDGDDRLDGGPGRDELRGGKGNDRLDGGADLDLASYALARGSYALSHAGASLFVQALAGGEGRDELVGVERLQFADRRVAFDLDGAAGLVARLIGAVFGPAAVHDPVYVGIGLREADAGLSALELARLALDAGPASAGSNDDVVRLLYYNVVGALPAPEVQAVFSGLLASGAHSRASLALLAAQTDEEALRIDLVGLAANGLDYAPA